MLLRETLIYFKLDDKKTKKKENHFKNTIKDLKKNKNCKMYGNNQHCSINTSILQQTSKLL